MGEAVNRAIQAIKDRVDLHDLASHLGLERPGGKGNYRSPGHKDTNPSLSIYERAGYQRWRDHSKDERDPEGGGDAIALVMTCHHCEFIDALRWLCEQYAIPLEDDRQQAPQPQTLAEHIAQQSRAHTEPAVEYLTGRGIAEEVARYAIKRGAVGWNTWHSPSVLPGEYGYGGPACAFIVRSANPGHVVAVDLRYQDPELNGGPKTKSQGDKEGCPWCIDWRLVKRAPVVVVVESAINALSAHTARSGLAAVATRGTGALDQVDWRFCRGKKVLIAMDNDEPKEKGARPGPEAGWRLHEILTAHNISAFMLDYQQWDGLNDLNDILTERGPEALQAVLNAPEQWAIPGLPGTLDAPGRRRVYLPPYDLPHYSYFRVMEDFTQTWVEEYDKETQEKRPKVQDVAAFRIAAITRIEVADPATAITGGDPRTKSYFAVSTQNSFHPNELIRKVVEYTQLASLDWWTRNCGAVWAQKAFMRLVSIWGRASHLGQRRVTNFVGLAWHGDEVVVSEGPDCYFLQPEAQCLYHDLTFPRGTVSQARTVINAYQATFGHNAAAQMLVWALGGHLKAFLGFWPHLVLQGRKGLGKTTLTERLQRSVGLKILGAEGLNTTYRMTSTLGYTSQPVGWDEVGTKSQKIRDAAIGMLQGCYKFAQHQGYQKMIPFLSSAPVLLIGEEVMARSLTGKLCRISLDQRGELMPRDLPAFPVRQWLEFLAAIPKQKVVALQDEMEAYARRHCRAQGEDDGAKRMVQNYAAILSAWRLLCEFAGIGEEQGNFYPDLLAEMNNHIAETSTDREPWVWIMEVLLAEIDRGSYDYPFSIQPLDHTVDCLVIRPSHIMQYIATSPGLRGFHEGLPIKTDTALKEQLRRAGIIHAERVDVSINRKRWPHMTALSIEKLEQFGLVMGREEEL